MLALALLIDKLLCLMQVSNMDLDHSVKKITHVIVLPPPRRAPDSSCDLPRRALQEMDVVAAPRVIVVYCSKSWETTETGES